MKFIGQFIKDIVARFRNDVYLEDVNSGTIASGSNLGLDSNNKIVKATITSADTTYAISCVDGDNSDEEKIRLTAGGSGSGTDDVVLEAGTGLSIARSGDKITFTNTVSDTDTNTMGSGFTVSATTDSNATTITQGDDLFFAAGTGITCETTADGTVTITNTVSDTNTQLSTEQVQDIVGAMLVGTETRIGVTYDDTNGRINFVVDDMTADTNTNQLTEFTLTGDSGSDQTIAHGNTLDIAGGNAISTVVGATDTVTINHDDTSSQASVNNSGRTYIQDITLDTYGHVTGLTSATETVSDTNTQLSDEQVQDIVGGMVTGNTESGITVAYQDADGTLDFTVGTLNQDTTGNAATATTLETARTIAGVSFNGSANISLNNNAITNGAGYTTSTGTVDTSGSPVDDDFAKFTDANTIEGRSIAETKTDLSLNNVENKSSATIRGEIVSGDIPNNAADTSGNAATATALATARNIGGVSFDGTGNINLPGVNTAGNQNTSGTAALATSVTATANNSANETVYPTFVDGATGTQGLETDTGLHYNPSSGLLTAQGIAAAGIEGDLTGDVTGDLDGNANTATALATARNIGGVSFNGTGNIDLPGVNAAGNQNTTGNAATATKLAATKTIAGVAFDGSANISLNNNAITNGAGYTTNTGDITGVTAGTNLSGGGASGAVTLNLADASTSAKGAASFSSDNFAVSSGAVTIKAGGVDLTNEVTGVLPSANLDADTAHYSLLRQCTYNYFKSAVNGTVLYVGLQEADAESTSITNKNLPILTGVAGKLLKVFVRTAADCRSVNITVTLKQLTTSYNVNTNNAATVGVQTGAGGPAGALHTFDFTSSLDSGTNVVGAGDMLFLGFNTDTEEGVGSSNWYVTCLWEWDYS